MIDPQVAFDKLAGMSTAQEIADYLKDVQVKGVPQAIRECPIANWMKNTTGLFEVRVGGWKLDLGVNTISTDMLVEVMDSCGQDLEFVMTKAMVEFVKEFDAENYPELLLYSKEEEDY